jgi:TRAP-type C4-dicarboxylate transport system substrate-binding protein
MNGDVYDSLPDDIRTIFDALVGEYNERSQLMWNTADYLGQSAGIANGVEFITLSETEAAKWVAAVQPVIDNWIAKMVDAGHSQAEVDGWIAFVQERIDFWTARQIAWHIKSAVGPPEVIGE